jgi:hypothetical protein
MKKKLGLNIGVLNREVSFWWRGPQREVPLYYMHFTWVIFSPDITVLGNMHFTWVIFSPDITVLGNCYCLQS